MTASIYCRFWEPKNRYKALGALFCFIFFHKPAKTLRGISLIFNCLTFMLRIFLGYRVDLLAQLLYYLVVRTNDYYDISVSAQSHKSRHFVSPLCKSRIVKMRLLFGQLCIFMYWPSGLSPTGISPSGLSKYLTYRTHYFARPPLCKNSSMATAAFFPAPIA